MIKPIGSINQNPDSTQGQVLSSTPVYPSGLRGYTGRALFLRAKSTSTMPGRSPLPGILLKRGGFSGGPGGFPRAQLDYSTTSKEHVTDANSRAY